MNLGEILLLCIGILIIDISTILYIISILSDVSNYLYRYEEKIFNQSYIHNYFENKIGDCIKAARIDFYKYAKTYTDKDLFEEMASREKRGLLYSIFNLAKSYSGKELYERMNEAYEKYEKGVINYGK